MGSFKLIALFNQNFNTGLPCKCWKIEIAILKFSEFSTKMAGNYTGVNFQIKWVCGNIIACCVRQFCEIGILRARF
jgi:hypothetical protein